jgi:hypothetical protein
MEYFGQVPPNPAEFLETYPNSTFTVVHRENYRDFLLMEA